MERLNNMKNYKNCFVAKLEGEVYFIPQVERYLFDETAYYDRQREFCKYLMPDDVIFEDVFIDMSDHDALIAGDLE